MEKKENDNKRGFLRQVAFMMNPVLYTQVENYISKKRKEPSEWNKAVFGAFDPLGNRSQIVTGGLDLLRRYITGDFEDDRGQNNSDELAVRVADAAWRKYNNMPYDESLVIDNGDGTFRYPNDITKKIRTRRRDIEKAVEVNKKKYKELKDSYDFKKELLIQDGEWEELNELEREWKNNEEAIAYSLAIRIDEENLAGMDSIAKGKGGTFNEFNYFGRSLKNDDGKEVGDLNVLGNFGMKIENGKSYYFDKWDLKDGKSGINWDRFSGGSPFDIKGKVNRIDLKKKSKDDDDYNYVHPFLNSSLKEMISSNRNYSDDHTVDEDHQYQNGGVVQKQRKAYDYFTNKRGMSQIQALAILGNLMAESGLVDNVYGDNNTSYGIQQWHNERKDALFKYAKKKGHKEPTFEDQIEFLADEYEGKTGYSNFLYKRKGKDGPGYYNYSLQDFQSAENLRDAVIAWNQGAGRPHKSVIRNDDRYNEALNVAKNIGVEVDVSAPSLYGQMGYKDSVSPISDNTVIEEGIIEGETANESVTSSVKNPEDEAMGKWVDTYGKDIIAQLMSMNGKEVSQSPEETGFDYKQYVKDEEEDKRKAIIQAVLPNIQLKIKGVTEVGK